MFETLPLDVKERIAKEGSLPKLISAFLMLAQDLIDSGEADEMLKAQNHMKIEHQTKIFK